MTIEWADVMPAQLFEKSSGCDHAFHVLLGALGKIPCGFHMLENLFTGFSER